MKIPIAMLFAGAMSIFSTGPLAKPNFEFSKSFKASIDNAMKKSTGADRGHSLMAAMDAETNEEVFFVFPLLFTPQIIVGVEKAGVCKRELGGNIDNLQAYQASPDPNSFPDAQSKKIRTDTANLVRWIPMSV